LGPYLPSEDRITFARDDVKYLSWFRDKHDEEFVCGAVIHSGPSIYELGERIFAILLCAIWG